MIKMKETTLIIKINQNEINLISNSFLKEIFQTAHCAMYHVCSLINVYACMQLIDHMNHRNCLVRKKNCKIQFKISCSPDPATNFETLNPNFHGMFWQCSFYKSGLFIRHFFHQKTKTNWCFVFIKNWLKVISRLFWIKKFYGSYGNYV